MYYGNMYAAVNALRKVEHRTMAAHREVLDKVRKAKEELSSIPEDRVEERAKVRGKIDAYIDCATLLHAALHGDMEYEEPKKKG